VALAIQATLSFVIIVAGGTKKPPVGFPPAAQALMLALWLWGPPIGSYSNQGAQWAHR